MVELIARWKETVRKLEDDLGRPPNTHEIATAMEVSPKKLQIIRRAMKAYHSSTQVPLGEDGETLDMADMFEDYRSEPPDEAIEQSEEFQLILRLLSAIDERDARVLKLRFGLEGQEPLTLKEIGKEIGLTRERVRQIEVEAIKKLQDQLMEDCPSQNLEKNLPKGKSKASSKNASSRINLRAKAS